jgi:hypothetical protein
MTWRMINCVHEALMDDESRGTHEDDKIFMMIMIMTFYSFCRNSILSYELC